MTDQAAYLDDLASGLRSVQARLDAMQTQALEAHLSMIPEPLRMGSFSGYGQPQVAASGQPQSYVLAPNSVTGESIADGAIADPAMFAASILPPEVVGTLPTLPDARYPQGRLVFLTTDQKLYRNTTGSAWSKAVDGSDLIADSVTTGAIAAGAVGADEIAANAITAGKVAAGAISADNLAIGLQRGQLDLVNLNFETGDLSGWSAQIGGAGNNIYTEGTGSGGEGSYCAVLYYNTTAPAPELQRLSLPCQPGDALAVDLLASKHVTLLVHWYTAVGGYLGNDTRDLYPSSLTRIRQAFAVAPATTGYAVFVVRNADLGSFLVVDDVHLYRTAGLVAGAGSVAIDASGIAVYNGKIVVASDSGSTVIIDGTSMMFKIAATGTLSKAVASGANGSTDSGALTGLGTFGTAPMAEFLCYSSLTGTYRYVGALTIYIQRYCAATSGASPTSPFWAISGRVEMAEYLDGSNYLHVSVYVDALAIGGITGYGRYYVLKEAGI